MDLKAMLVSEPVRSVTEFLKVCETVNKEKPGLTYLIDHRLSNERFLVASLPRTNQWFEIPTAAVQSITPLQTIYNDDLEGILCRLRFAEQFASLPPLLARAPGLAKGVEAQLQAPQTLGRAGGTESGGLDAPRFYQTKTFTWPTLYSGDCQMHNARLQFWVDDKNAGHCDFYSTVLTQHTHSGDYWHMRIEVRSASGALLFQCGPWTGPRMDDGNPPPHYSFQEIHGCPGYCWGEIYRCVAYYSC